jgi:hypothetical protein
LPRLAQPPDAKPGEKRVAQFQWSKIAAARGNILSLIFCEILTPRTSFIALHWCVDLWVKEG